ncbi:hypothetical protein BH09VER1_BH09VER1_28850 [soil metagenome]
MREGDQTEASAMLEEYLRRVRSQFMADLPEKAYFQQRRLLIQAITFPAAYLHERGVWLPVKRLREILDEIIKGIKHHGATDRIQYFGIYFLTAVQSHMKIRQEAYYEEGKLSRTKPIGSMPLAEVMPGVKVADHPAQVTDHLAEFARLARSGPRPGAKKVAKQPQQQMDFLL